MKFLLRKFPAVILLSTLVFNTKAEVVYSIDNGLWNNADIWSNNAVPKPTDTVIVDHYVIISDTLFIDSTGSLIIDSCGTLCGDEHLQGHFTNYGNMYIGSFGILVPSYTYGNIICNNTGSSWVGNGYLTMYSGSVQIGANVPPCIIPRSTDDGCQRTAINQISKEISFCLYPNPTNDEITLAAETDAPMDVFVYDITGNCLRSVTKQSSFPVTINTATLPTGYYLLKLKLHGDSHADNDRIAYTKCFIITR